MPGFCIISHLIDYFFFIGRANSDKCPKDNLKNAILNRLWQCRHSMQLNKNRSPNHDFDHLWYWNRKVLLLWINYRNWGCYRLQQVNARKYNTERIAVPHRSFVFCMFSSRDIFFKKTLIHPTCNVVNNTRHFVR